MALATRAIFAGFFWLGLLAIFLLRYLCTALGSGWMALSAPTYRKAAPFSWCGLCLFPGFVGEMGLDVEGKFRPCAGMAPAAWHFNHGSFEW
jgi:hypothetical protein